MEKWKGQVMGNEQEIFEALKQIGREPKDYKELEDIIFANRTKALNELLSEAANEVYNS